MRGFLLAIAILALILGLSAWAGWWTIESTETDTNIRIDKTEVESDTQRVTDSAKRLTKEAAEEVDRTIEDEPDTDVVVEPN